MRFVVAFLILLSTLASRAEEPSDGASIQPAQVQLTEPLHPALAPILLPTSMILPGSAHYLRGESATGRRLMTTAGIGFGAGLLGMLAIAYSGAADLVTIPAIPLVMTGVGTFLTAGSLDWAGAFSSNAPARFHSPSLSPWNAATLARMSYMNTTTSITGLSHYSSISGHQRVGDFLVTAKLLSEAKFRSFAVEGGGAYPLLDGLQLSLDLRYQRERVSKFQNLRTKILVTSILPFAEKFTSTFPTLGSLTWIMRLGALQTFRTYDYAPDAGWDSDWLITGGFEVQWNLIWSLRPFWGYEHARDDLLGGASTGFAGVFYLGSEYEIIQSTWLSARVYQATPFAIELGLEKRW